MEQEFTKEVCIAHYNEDLAWVHNLKCPYKVISRQNIPAETPPNKGNEASSFLEYIINNYENLADYTFFVHGHRNSYHHNGNTDDIINTCKIKHDYYNFNNIQQVPLTYFRNVIQPCIPEFETISKIINYDIKWDQIHYRHCAQFYVKRELIQQYPKEVYQKLYDYLMATPIQSYYSGRLFEYVWHVIFLRTHVDIELEDI